MHDQDVSLIYSDGAFDHKNKIGAGCIVYALPDEKPTYKVFDCDKATSTDVEIAALRVAVNFAIDWHAHTGVVAVVFCDSLSAIRVVEKMLTGNSYVALEHIRAHTVGDPDYPLNDDIKRQHWCDTLARQAVKKRLDIINRSVDTHAYGKSNNSRVAALASNGI